MTIMQVASVKQRNNVRQAFIARELNLSVATVSKALRGLPEVNRETSRKVMEIARLAGYSANRHCIMSKQKKTGYSLAGVLINSSSFSAARTGYLEGISREAIKKDFSILTHYAQQQECELLSDLDNLPWAMRDKEIIGGLIFIHHWPDNVVKAICREYHCVSIMHEYSHCKADFVGVNNESGIATMMDYLYQEGHRKIGFFGHTKDLSWSRGRFSGYTNSLCKLGLEVNPKWIIEVEANYQNLELQLCWERHLDFVEEQVRLGTTAWMCASDFAGYKLCHGLSARGLRIPDDVAITGFDSNEVSPDGFSLTSVKVQSHEMGAAALRCIRMRAENPEMPRQAVKFDCDFIKGNTA
jgi:DNA-binding LacI/PurR family transcriptional regulator